MLMAILAIATFQVYWLKKNYSEEHKLLRLRTNLLFREAVNQSQVTKLKLDTNITIQINSRNDAANIMNAFRQRIQKDTIGSSGKIRSAVIISMDKEQTPVSFNEQTVIHKDSLKKTIQYFNEKSDRGLIQILQGVDSLQDSVTVNDVKKRFTGYLQKEKINVPFSISRKQAIGPDDLLIPEMENANAVTIGFYKPITFILDLQNAREYILKRLAMPISVSILLVGLTALSFLIMLRNLVKQRRLAELKNEFVSNITHELKTPIATVGVAIEALRNFNALNDPERTKEYLDISSSEIHRLGLLVDKVLKLSMFENKEITLQNESLDILALTQEVMASMKLQFEKKQAVIKLETKGTNFMIEADKLHITSVVYNLLDNALKYSKEIPRIDVVLATHAQHISLEISDKGIGIPKEYEGKIFEKFFRIPGGDQHNTKGYGLGLSYVNHIVQRHMGFIEVKSELGIGSTFIVNIPYKQADRIRFDKHRVIRREKI